MPEVIVRERGLAALMAASRLTVAASLVVLANAAHANGAVVAAAARDEAGGRTGAGAGAGAEALAEAGPDPATDSAAPFAVTIDLSAIGRADFHRLAVAELYKKLLVRLVEEGVAVVALDSPADIILRLAVEGGTVAVSVSGRGLDAPALAPIAIATSASASASADVDALHSRVTSWAVDLVRASRARLRATRQNRPAAAGSEPAEDRGGGRPDPRNQAPRESSAPITTAELPRAQGGISAGGALLPGEPTAWMATLGGDLEVAGSWRGTITAALSRPLMQHERLTVTEWAVWCGAAYENDLLSTWLVWRAGAAAGLWWHGYTYDPPLRDDESGRLLSAVLVLDGRLGVRVSSRAEVGVHGSLLAFPGSRVHRENEAKLWRAGIIRPALALFAEIAF